MNTLFIGHPVIELDSVESTNTYAIDLLKQKNCAEGIVIFAHEQSKGRGQRGNNWITQPLENLTFSVVLKPSFVEVHKQFIITQIISLAVADYLTYLLNEYYKHDKTVAASEIKIKWSNDLYVGDNKIAGILIENSVRENKIINTVVGIGLNVNQIIFDKTIPNPTSLKIISGEHYDIKKCLEELCSFIEARYLLLKAGKTKQIDMEYKNSLYKLNEVANFSANGINFSGKITGITEQGLLTVEKQSGETINYGFKEISFVLIPNTQ